MQQMTPEETNDVEERPIPTSCDAVFHLAEYRRYAKGQCEVSQAIFQSLNILEDCSKKSIEHFKTI